MIKRKPLSILFIPILLNILLYINVNIADQNFISRGVDIDRSNIPKNILFGSFSGGRSHVKPMMDIAEILIERGYNVILLAPGKDETLSEYPTVKQISLIPIMSLRDVGIEVNKEVLDHKKLAGLFELSVKYYKSSYEKYKSVAEEHNIDLFFCDIVINEACVDVAHTLKKPVVGFTSGLQLMDPKPYKSDPIFGCNISLENESILERFRCNFIPPLQLIYSFFNLMSQLNDIRGQMNIEPGRIALGKSPKASLILVDTFFGFELPQTLPPYVQEIGPILSEKYPSLTPELSDFINKHESVLYVAFGTRFFTTTDNNSKLLQSFIEAINKKIVDGVIWSLVETSKDDFYPTLNLSDGTQVQTSSILNNEHPHIHIAKFVPQFTVLNHNNTKLFFSHGGAGSSHESLYTGTPMLVLPFAGDQIGNAQKLVTAGVASSLSISDFDVDDILNKMDSLLKDENVRKSLERMKILAKINSKRKYRAADLIEYILHTSSFVDVNDDFLKEWYPAEDRMGFIRAYNLDIYIILISIVLSIIGIIIRAIAYYVLQEYDKALLDLNKVIQLDPQNSLPYYYKGLIHYAIGNANDALLAFIKCIELYFNDDFAKVQLYYSKYLPKNNSSKDLDHSIVTKINQIADVYQNNLLYMRCKVYIKLEKYLEAKLDLDKLLMLNEKDIPIACLLREYSNFCSYLFKIYKINDTEFNEIGIVNKFSKLLYKVFNVYFVSNLTTLNNELYIEESNLNSLSEKVLCFKNEAYRLNLPKLINDFTKDFHYVIWKINVKKILFKDCFVSFLIVEGKKDSNVIYSQKEYLLNYDDLLKLEGSSWIECTLPIKVNYYQWIQLSIEVNKGSIDMQIDYVRFKKSFSNQIYFLKTDHLLPIHELLPTVPEVFRDKYFSKKEMENLLELNAILNNL
ncbi:hypothetical protein RclHR1_14480002 [Rhizophagus clarus]|uniref:Glycosyltransferase family 1 protein n=1 Tax=Rhizophagus clarus TaxID=94130 RepID=A0A2Z6QQ71_9GLOM|nr:hypothetical protein RclHR1_14480002 [Rhizophagus clarus]GES80319.1 glycosyltransferase family 1 protein [Rhizophagus clarus]